MGGVEPQVERLPDSSHANGIPNQTVLPTIRPYGLLPVGDRQARSPYYTLVHGNGQTPPSRTEPLLAATRSMLSWMCRGRRTTACCLRLE